MIYKRTKGSRQIGNYLAGVSRQISNYFVGLSRQIAFPYKKRSTKIWYFSALKGKEQSTINHEKPSAVLSIL